MQRDKQADSQKNARSMTDFVVACFCFLLNLRIKANAATKAVFTTTIPLRHDFLHGFFAKSRGVIKIEL